MNYIFDFGNVFINLDLKATEKILKTYGLNELTPKTLQHIYKYEKGLISTDSFISCFLDSIPNATYENVVEAWNSIILDFPNYRLDFIENFCQNKSCYLLSNINELHLNYIQKNLTKTFYKRFINSFDKVYYSHLINMRKPDKEIFEYVLKDIQSTAGSCFFIDDNSENIQTATKMGFKTWHLKPESNDIIYLNDILLQYKINNK